MQPADVAQLDTDLKLNGRIERDGWIAQARAMIEAAAKRSLTAPHAVRRRLNARLRARRSPSAGLPISETYERTSHGEHYRCDGEGAARQDRRRHDGLQGRPHRDRRRHRRPRSTGCARRASRRPPRRPAASPPRASSPSSRRATPAAILEVNSETDFVARNDQFQAFVREAAKIAPAWATAPSSRSKPRTSRARRRPSRTACRSSSPPSART